MVQRQLRNGFNLIPLDHGSYIFSCKRCQEIFNWKTYSFPVTYSDIEYDNGKPIGIFHVILIALYDTNINPIGNEIIVGYICRL